MEGQPRRCEHCGYSFFGLPGVGAGGTTGGAAGGKDACPECGRPIADSLPSRRPGSAWQRRRNAASWLLTLLSVTLFPRHTFACIRFPEPGAKRLLIFNAAFALVLFAATVLLTLILGPGTIRLSSAPNTFTLIFDTSLPRGTLLSIMAALMPLYVWIRNRLIPRAWRDEMYSDVHWCVHAHASFSVVALAIAYLAAWTAFRCVAPADLSGPATATMGGLVRFFAALPTLVMYAGLVYLCILSWLAERANRFASPGR